MRNIRDTPYRKYSEYNEGNEGNEEKTIKGYLKLIVAGIVGLAGVMILLAIILYCWANLRLVLVDYKGRALELEKQYQGRAILAEAEFAKQARVESAKAEEEAATHTANAIEIVGEKAALYPEYRQQEFYLSLGEALQQGNINQILYLPTEAGLPITEAGKRR